MTDPLPRTTIAYRWDAIDVARGVAIVAMVVYHVSWDLSFLQLVSFQVVGVPAWNWFARAVAGTFLVLAGIGLALAHARGFRRLSFLRRLAKVAGAALAVTLVTAFAFPDSYVFFGILHAIAVGSILALPFLWAPGWLAVATALLSFATPRLFTDPALDHPLLDWLGLGSQDPLTNDYVPVFPWFGSVLLGLVLGRMLLRTEAGFLARWRASNPLTRAVAWAGRKSLPIYLIHQPVLLALFYGVLQLTGPDPQAQARPFVSRCTDQCTQTGGDESLCRSVCACIVEELRRVGAFERVAADHATPEDRTRVSEAAQMCLRRDPR